LEGFGEKAMQKSSRKKKTLRKALIPLPPTGFASLFCAKVRAVQTPALPRPAAGAVGVVSIARSARFCKKEQRKLHCVTERRRVGQESETPGAQGLRPEKPTAQDVFVFGTGRTSWGSDTAQSACKTAVMRRLLGSPVFSGIAQRHQGITCDQCQFA
jgi:hypothetical protein